MKNQRTRKGLATIAVIAMSGLGLAACADDSGEGNNEVSGDAPGAGNTGVPDVALIGRRRAPEASPGTNIARDQGRRSHDSALHLHR